MPGHTGGRHAHRAGATGCRSLGSAWPTVSRNGRRIASALRARCGTRGTRGLSGETLPGASGVRPPPGSPQRMAVVALRPSMSLPFFLGVRHRSLRRVTPIMPHRSLWQFLSKGGLSNRGVAKGCERSMVLVHGIGYGGMKECRPSKRAEPAGTPSEKRQGRCPVGNRPAHEQLVFSPRRAVIIIDLAATRAIFPVPTRARILRRPLELLLSDGGAVPPKAGVILEGLPRGSDSSRCRCPGSRQS